MTSSGSNPTQNGIRFVSESQPNSVYKYYDAHGILIYVGITKAGITRNRQHNTDKFWWPFVASQSVEHCESRDRALAVEAELINQFRPPFNIKHNPDHEDIRAAYMKLQASGQLAMSARQLLTQKGGKSELPLVPISYGDDEHHVFVIMAGHFVDKPLWLCVRSAGCNVPVLNRAGHRLGTVREVQTNDDGNRVVVALRREHFSYPPRVLRGVARMRYPQLKPSVVAIVRNIHLEFLIRKG